MARSGGTPTCLESSEPAAKSSALHNGEVLETILAAQNHLAEWNAGLWGMPLHVVEDDEDLVAGTPAAPRRGVLSGTLTRVTQVTDGGVFTQA